MNNSRKLDNLVHRWTCGEAAEVAQEVSRQGLDLILRLCVRLASLWGPNEIDRLRLLVAGKPDPLNKGG